MKIVILHDSIPTEGAGPDQTDVLIQADAVEAALVGLGHQCRTLPFSLNLGKVIEAIKQRKPDLIFNLVESVEGSGRLIHMAPSILDFLGIPYTGSSTDVLYVTSNKRLTKWLLTSAGIPTPESLSTKTIRDASRFFEGTYIIKSLWEHASIGLDDDSIVTVRNPSQLLRAMENHQSRLGGECFAERYIEGREFNLSLLAAEQDPQVLPPAEVRFDAYPPERRRIVGYRAKWVQDSFEYRHTRRSFVFKKNEKPLLKKMADMAGKCWDLFGLRGYGRVDFRVDEEGRPWVLEVNANPCLSPDAGFVAAAFKRGLGFEGVIKRIILDTCLCDSTDSEKALAGVNSPK